MDRRQFGLTTLASGLALALRPAVVLAGDPKYTHVADMYPWDVRYDKKETITNLPPPLKLVKEFNIEQLTKGSEVFKDPKKIREVIPILLDQKVDNEELGTILLWKECLGLRVLTNDSSFGVENLNEREKEKFGPTNVYIVGENMDYQKIRTFAKCLNIDL